MLFDFAALSGRDCYKILVSTIVPRPIAWITSLGEDGTVNAAPYSFFNAMSGDPPIVVIGIDRRPDGVRKDSALNIIRSGEFVVNMVSFDTAEAMNITAIDFPFGTSEVEKAGLTTAPSSKLRTPRIAESPVAFECERFQVIELEGSRDIVLGRVLAAYVRDDSVLDAEQRYIDTPKLDLVGRMHGRGWYTRATDRFDLPRKDLEDWPAK